MLLPDVNLLVYAYRADSPDHARYRDWLDGVVNGDEAYGLSDFVLSGVLRVVTHPRVFNPPSPIRDVLSFVELLRAQPQCVRVEPGARHWEIFTRLCRAPGVKGNHVPDAWLAALAIESGSEFLTSDGGFARFPGLRWRHPLSSG